MPGIESKICYAVGVCKMCIRDRENIKLALQSYNYGNGYLEWAKARGGYTLANAAEFSDMMAQRMGSVSYTHLPLH